MAQASFQAPTNVPGSVDFSALLASQTQNQQVQAFKPALQQQTQFAPQPQYVQPPQQFQQPQYQQQYVQQQFQPQYAPQQQFQQFVPQAAPKTKSAAPTADQKRRDLITKIIQNKDPFGILLLQLELQLDQTQLAELFNDVAKSMGIQLTQ